MTRYVYDLKTGERTEHPDLPLILEPDNTPPQDRYMVALDAFIDAEAKSHGYDSRITCALRAGYAGPFQAEGIAFASWMDGCYAQGTAELARVLSGQRATPSVDEFLRELPPMVWPESGK